MAKPASARRVSALVIRLATSSTSRNTGTGLKKWMPITCSGRAVAVPSFMIGIELVLLARIAPSASDVAVERAEDRRPSVGSSSTTASTTSWRSAKSARSVVNASRASAASRCLLAQLAGVEAAVERLHQPSPPRLGGCLGRPRAPARRARPGRTPRRSRPHQPAARPHRHVRSPPVVVPDTNVPAASLVRPPICRNVRCLAPSVGRASHRRANCPMPEDGSSLPDS